MRNLAETLDHSIQQEVATIIEVKSSGLQLRTHRGMLHATRAASCLLEPTAGDRVICALTPTGQAWVLAILERPDASVARLSTGGDLEVCASNGKVSIVGKDGVEMATPKEVSVTAGKLQVNAVEGNVVLQRLTYLGRFVQSEVKKVKAVAETFDAVLGRFSQRVKRSYRTVEEYDCVKAKQIDYVAKSTASIHAQTTMMTAEALVKIDGSQVHVG